MPSERLLGFRFSFWKIGFMEELRSTEILDKEIQAEARKKAEKIVRSAEAEAKSLEEQVALRLEKAKSDKEEKNAAKLSALEKDLEATFPLEKERFLVSYIQESIDKGMNGYFSSLSDEEIVSVLLGELSRYDEKLAGRPVNAYVYGLDVALAEKSLKKKVNLLSVEKTEFNRRIQEQIFGLEKQKGIIVETQDKEIVLRLTLSEIVSRLEENYREELYEKLFAGRL